MSDVTRGENARQVIDNPAYQEAWDDLEEAYIEALIEQDKEADGPRFRLSEGIKVLRMVKRHLESTMEAGDVKAKDLREIENGKRSFF